MTNIIAIANAKGGVGKTTTTIHLGVSLARRGRRVLLLDLDPQAHLLEYIDQEDLREDISDVIAGGFTIDDILCTIEPNLKLAPSTLRLGDMEQTLVNVPFREYKLQKALKEINIKDYDYILIDCPPNLGMLTFNALMAATHVLIPMSAEYYSMLGVSSLLKKIPHVQEANPQLAILGIIHTRVKHTIHAREVVETTKRDLKTNIPVFEHLIHESTKFMEAAEQGKTVFDWAPETPGALAYGDIVEDIDRKLITSSKHI